MVYKRYKPAKPNRTSQHRAFVAFPPARPYQLHLPSDLRYFIWEKNYKWRQPKQYQLSPDKVDPALLNGKILARAARTTAVSFNIAAAKARISCKVKVSNTAEFLVLPRALLQGGGVVDSVAERGVRMLTQSDLSLQGLLREGGLLDIPTDKNDKHPCVFRLAAYNTYFSRLAYVN